MKSVLADLVLKLSANSAELTRGLTEANKSLSGIGKNTSNIGGQITGALAKITGAFYGIKEGIEFFKSSLLSTAETADKFEATIEGFKQGFDAIKRAVATLDFKDFIKNVKNAINEGRRYAENLDDIDEKTRHLKMQEADYANQIIEQTKIQRSASSTKAEQIAAGKEIIRLEEELASVRTSIAKQGYENEITNIASITKLTNNEVEAYLRGEKGILDKLSAAKVYTNALKEQKNILEGATYSQRQLTDDERKQYQELNKIIESTTDEIKKYAYANDKMATDPKLNLAVQKYVEWQEAFRSATENTMRSSLRLDAALDKQGDSFEKTTTSLQDYMDGLDELLKYKAPIEIENYTPENIDKYYTKLPTETETPILFDENQLTNLEILQKAIEHTAYCFQQGWITPLQMIKTQTVDTFKIMSQSVVNYGDIIIIGLVSAINSLSNAFGNLFSESTAGFKDVVTVALQTIQQIIKALLAQAIAVMIATEAHKGILGLISGLAGVGLLLSLWKSKVPKFAEGGIVYGNSLVNVGEYPGVRSNPEIITPLDKLKTILATNLMSGEVIFKIEGTDLIGVLNKQIKINSL